MLDQPLVSSKMLFEKDGGIGRIIFNNPARHNAVSLDMWQAVAQIMEDFEHDPEIRVIVLSGAGGKAFVSGADISEFKEKRATAEAAEEYSRMVGIIDAKLDPFSFASHPVLVRVGGSYYARSIQRVEPDGSLHFFCAIDEGMVLTAASSRSLVGSTRDTFAEIRDQIGDVSLYIGFECLLRRLDAEQHQLARDMSELYRLNRVVGFHTYGEQFGSMHVNQTFTGVAIGRRPS